MVEYCLHCGKEKKHDGGIDNEDGWFCSYDCFYRYKHDFGDFL